MFECIKGYTAHTESCQDFPLKINLVKSFVYIVVTTQKRFCLYLLSLCCPLVRLYVPSLMLQEKFP